MNLHRIAERAEFAALLRICDARPVTGWALLVRPGP